MYVGNRRIFVSLFLVLTVLAVAPMAAFAGGLYISGDNVGIGTASPRAKLDVASEAQASEIEIRTSSDTGHAVLFHGTNTGGTLASPTYTPNDRTLLSVGGQGHNGTNWTTGSSASIRFRSTEDWTPTAHGAEIRLGTTQNGTTVNAERMRITNDGKIGIGTTAPTEALDVAGNIRTATGTVTAASFSGSGSGLTNINPTNITSGTANINISGNAATVTNGIYSTGSYADPSWITSLAGSKITGDISGNAATATTAASASTATTATTANSVAAGAVSTGGLAYGAVTPEKIAFYSNVAIVAPSGGDYDNPATAMSNYTSWCREETAEPSTNPCLLKIMPGVYTIGTSTVQMQPYIDIEGSGENVTVIQGNIDSFSSGVVTGASNAELRFLTVKNTGGGLYAMAIRTEDASPKLTNVTAIASGASSLNYGVSNSFSSPTMINVTATASGASNNTNAGVDNMSSSPVMTNVTATASGGSDLNVGVANNGGSPVMTNVTATASGGTASRGVINSGSSPVMTNVTATASEGTYNYGVYNYTSGTVKINHSVIKGSSNTIYNASGVTAYVGNTQLDGGAVSNTGTLTCAGVYDESYTFYASTCP